MAASCLTVLCLCVLLVMYVSGQIPSLTGPSSGVLGSSVHLICTLPGSSAIAQLLPFSRGAAGSLCIVNITACSQFSAASDYSCGCVSGQTRELYLNISSLSLQDDDTWRCSFSGVNSNSIRLKVYHQTPSLTGPTSGVLGSSVHLICTVPGSSVLEGGLIFTRTGVAGYLCIVNAAECSQFRTEEGYSCGCVSGQTQEFYLNISSLRKQDDDVWWCTYSGVISNNISLSAYFLNRPNFTTDQTEVREDEGVKLKCSAQSNPIALLTVRNIDNDIVILQEETNELTYTIPKAQCLHNGSFVCSGDNKAIGVLYSKTRYLNVLCSPRLDTRKPFKRNFSSGIGEIAYLLLNVISNPPPTFTWFLSNNQLLVPIPNVTKHEVISTAKFSVLQIHVLHIRDFASYVVEATSNHVTFTMTFNLLRTDSGLQEAPTYPFGMGIGIGIVIGIASVLPVIGIVVYVCLRRQKTIKEGPKENRETETDMSSAQRDADNRATYSDLTNTPGNEYEELRAQPSEVYEDPIPLQQAH